MLFNSLSKMEKVKFYTTYEYLYYYSSKQKHFETTHKLL